MLLLLIACMFYCILCGIVRGFPYLVGFAGVWARSEPGEYKTLQNASRGALLVGFRRIRKPFISSWELFSSHRAYLEL